VITTVLLSLLTAVMFVLVALHTTGAAIQRVDDRFLKFMVENRSSSATAVAKVLNILGLVYVTLPARVAVAVFLAVRRRWWHLAAFVGAVVLSEVCIGPIKALYARPRPPASLVHTSGASFPSGHAVAASVTVVGAVIALFPEGGKRYAWGAAAVAFSLVMGLSRAYLGAHWLSDAVAGTLLGTSIALGTAVVIHFVRERTRAG